MNDMSINASCNRLDESQIETVTVDYFRGLGYGYAHGPSIAPDLPAATTAAQAGGDAPERADYGQVGWTQRGMDKMDGIDTAR